MIARIHLPWGEDVPDDVPLTIDRKKWCPHRNVRLDGTARRVYCAACHDEVDAFTALNNLAREHQRWQQGIDSAKAESMRVHGELEDVKRELKNAKARKRRAG